MSSNGFESNQALGSYLLAHYGAPEQRFRQHPEARGTGCFVADCITEPLRHITLANHRRALDLGCSTGRSTFELRRFFDEVIGLDRSHAFISAADKMQRERSITADVERTPGESETIRFDLPPHLSNANGSFIEGDACALDPSLGRFDLVNMAQLIDRVPEPSHCLRQMADFVEPGGWFILTSSCNWQEKYTPREKWLGGHGGGLVAPCQAILAPSFTLHHHFHLRYLIRDCPHWYEWSVAEVSIWHRSESLSGW